MQTPNRIEEAHLAIVRALAALIPDSWRTATLDIERTESTNGGVDHSLVIHSGSGGVGTVAPSEELTLAVRELDLLFVQHGHPFKTLKFTVRRSDDDGWDFAVAHTYEDSVD